ncbi:sensor histidine kinase [Adhaeribacter terreus]|uniref:histidine kinase n=1 Tax=Adhaeribacter terreus TaxID=529703 RepID=A0ABW0E9N2_9BACT
MNLTPKTFILIISVLLSLMFGSLFHRPSGVGLLTSEESVSKVEVKIDSVLARANRSAKHLEGELLAGNHDFKNLLTHTQYPTFIFESGKLLFWSDNSTLSDFENIYDLKEEQLVENKFGKFLVVKHPVEPDFLVLVCVPLEINYGINNRYLVSGLNPDIFGDLKTSLVVDLAAKLPEIYSPRGNYLFSILPIKDDVVAVQRNLPAFFLFSIAVIFTVSLLHSFRKQLWAKGKHLRAVLFFISGILVLRIVLLFFNFPSDMLRIGLFDPKYYAASFWSPSIGDLLLNASLVLLIGIELIGLQRNKTDWYTKLKLNEESAIWLKIVTLVAFYFLLWLMYQFYVSIYTNSLLVLDITQSLDFDFYKIALLTGILINTAAFMCFSYLLMIAYFSLPRFSFYPSLFVLFGLAFVFTITNFMELSGSFLVFAALLFTAILQVWEARVTSDTLLPDRQYLFGILIVALSAWIGSMALFRHYHEQLQVHKQQFAKTLTQENDVVSEFLLEKVATEVLADPLIRKKMSGALVDPEFIKQKIQKYYLRNDFEKYETVVKIFDVAGKHIGSADSINSVVKQRMLLVTRAERTSYPNLFLLRSNNELNSRSYVKIISVPVSNKAKATIIIELHPKKLTPRSVIPELLVDQKSIQPLQSKSLSYAIYKDKELRTSVGDYDYGYQFDPTWLESERIFTTGREGKRRDHLAIRQVENTVLVISTNKYLLSDIWSNFSFLFLLHLAFFLTVLSIYLLARGEFFMRFRSNFSTKIQIFLNFGIFVPLLLISISIGSLITDSYQKDLSETYEKRGQLIQDNLTAALKNGTDFTDKTRLEGILIDFSNLSEADINFYSADGKLQASSQPLIFEAGLLSKLINPQAYAALTEDKKKHILVNEKAGLLNFSSLYLPVYGNGSQRLLGFISLPFFDSEKELNIKLIELATTILNIFTLMFIGFMVLTYLAARVLTVPLNLITEKLKQTTLTGQNERIIYNSNDEIGLLVKEYNQMISKLEESKEELAVKEKEAAWREMARQVAHEIKNPLTPMKLSLQYLQKAIAEKRNNVDELISKISQTLITNIDILSDIATSFSSFTALPELKPERINLATVLKRSVDLNHDPLTAKFETSLAVDDVHVMADEKLLMRTFNNLFLNALQAIPAGREPFIQVSLREVPGNKVLVSIKDNGSGIPAEVQDKVFIPNFSTKYSGSGIGLAVAKKGIEGAGGRIWFETVENEGTTFFIELPLA